MGGGSSSPAKSYESPGGSAHDSSNSSPYGNRSLSSSSDPGSPKFSPGIARKRSAIEEIRYQAEQTAERAAKSRFDRISRAQSLGVQGIPTAPLGSRDKLLLSIAVRPPQELQVTTQAISLKWETEKSAGAARIKRYDLQWRVAPEGHSPPGGICAWSLGDADERVPFTTGDSWSSVPECAIFKLKMQANFCQLPRNAPPLIFRVRGRCNAGWGPWSEVSKPVQVLNCDMPSPVHGLITATSIEIRWTAMRDARYGKLRRYELMGRTDHEEDSWQECYTGAQPKVVVERLGNRGLHPFTRYLFKVVTVASHGDVTDRDESQLESGILTLQTSSAAPSAPQPPKITSFTHDTISLSWLPPPSNGSTITSFTLLGKVGTSPVYTEYYMGPDSRVSLGARPGRTSPGHSPSHQRIHPSTEYNFKLSATNAHGTSPCSTPIFVFTDPRPLGEEELLSPAPSPPLTESKVAPTNRDVHATQDTEAYTTTSVDSAAPAAVPGRNQSARSVAAPVTPGGSGSGRVRTIEGGWLECWDEKEQAMYYFHPHSGCTQWEHPNQMQQDPDLVFRRKRFRFLYVLHRQQGSGDPAVRSTLPLFIERDQIVYSSFEQLKVLSSEDLRTCPRITFMGEAGIDSGGVTKDWFLSLSRQLVDPHLCLFTSCASAKSPSFVIDPRSSVNPHHLAYFYFVGRMLGMAVYHRHLVAVKFPIWFYKQLIGNEVLLADIASTDEEFHNSLKWILQNPVEDAGDFEFTVVKDGFGTSEVVELVPGGADIVVTNANKDLYVALLVHWKVCGAVKHQMEAVCRGFYEVVPQKQISVFSPAELEMLLVGKPHIDVHEIQAGASYSGGYNDESPTIKVSAHDRISSFVTLNIHTYCETHTDTCPYADSPTRRCFGTSSRLCRSRNA